MQISRAFQMCGGRYIIVYLNDRKKFPSFPCLDPLNLQVDISGLVLRSGGLEFKVE